jgi:hypothetical protein
MSIPITEMGVFTCKIVIILGKERIFVFFEE